MKKLSIVVMAAVVVTVGCSEDQARPDSYWKNHPDEARTQRKECGQNVEIVQAIKTTPPEAMTTKERECLYLIRQWEDPKRDELNSLFDDE